MDQGETRTKMDEGGKGRPQSVTSWITSFSSLTSVNEKCGAADADYGYGRGGGVGRGLGVGVSLGVAVTVAVGVGVGPNCAQYLPPVFK